MIKNAAYDAGIKKTISPQNTLLPELPGHRNGQARAKHRQGHGPYF
jgi:hypothetical protein